MRSEHFPSHGRPLVPNSADTILNTPLKVRNRTEVMQKERAAIRRNSATIFPTSRHLYSTQRISTTSKLLGFKSGVPMKQRSLRPPRAAGRPFIPEGAEGTKKKEAGRSSEHTEPLTTERLCGIWEKILSDTDGRRALKRLDEAGFPISHLKPTDATFMHPSWADYIAALPLLPNRPSTRIIHSKISLRKYRPLVEKLRQFAATVNLPFTELRIYGSEDYPNYALSSLRDELLKAATMLEHFLSWDYSVRNLNPRNAIIAELRWTIRQRTGRPHDRELNDLIGSAFRVIGSKEDCYIDSTALDRIEKRQQESRTKAHKRIRSLVNPPSPSGRRSTRIRRNSRKRV
jgi:hypothetical protein